MIGNYNLLVKYMQDSSNQTDTRTIMDKIKQEITPSLISGGIAVIASNMLLGVDLSSRYPLLGYNIPSWLAIGGANTYNPLGGTLTFLNCDDVTEAITVMIDRKTK